MDELKTVFNALQELDMKPTPHNVSIMNGVYDILRMIYQEQETGVEAEEAKE